jgi:integrase
VNNTSISSRLDTPPRITVEAAHSKHREQDTVFIRSDMVEPLKERVNLLASGEPLFPLLAQRKTWKMIKTDLTAAGIPYVDEHGKYADFHSLRHRFVTDVWLTINTTGAAISPPTSMSFARHRQLSTTMLYTHVDTSAQLRAIEAMKPPQKNCDDPPMGNSCCQVNSVIRCPVASENDIESRLTR